MAWATHAPTTPTQYKNFARSPEIRQWAMLETQCARFCTPIPGYGKGKGESVMLRYVSQLAASTPIDVETSGLPVVRPTVTGATVTVKQFGLKIETTEYEELLTDFDLPGEFKTALKDQMSRTLDLRAKTAFASSPIKLTPTTASGLVFDTDGTASATATRNLTVTDLMDARDYLASATGGRQPAPMLKRQRYVMIGSVKACRGIKDSPQYESWQASTTSAPMVDNFIRDIAGFWIYETNHIAAFSESLGSGGVLGEAILFGEDTAGMVVVQDPVVRIEQHP